MLIAMSAGELPWDQATVNKRAYLQWTNGKHNIHVSPWSKIDNLQLCKQVFKFF